MNINEKNIKKYSLISSLLIFVFLIFAISFFIISEKVEENKKQILDFKSKIELEDTIFLKNQVNSLIDIIDLYHVNSQKSMRNDIQNSLDNIYVILKEVYNSNKDKLSKKDLKKLIINTISKFKNSKENGYYFAIDIDTTVTYVHARDDFVGKTMNQIAGKKAMKVFNNYLTALNHSSKNSAFAYAKVAKPGTKSMKLFEKVTYLKRFEPFNIMGTSKNSCISSSKP